MEGVEVRGEGVEVETHEILVFPTFYNDLIMRGVSTATPRFPKGFQGFRVGDLDTFKTEQEFPLFLIMRAPPAEKLVLPMVFMVSRDSYHVSGSTNGQKSDPWLI